MKTNDEELKKVKEIFTRFLEEKKYRKTLERYAILEEIYKFDGHFDVETLYLFIKKNNKFHISRATLYNTLELLLESKLVIRHQFEGKSAVYEKALTNKQHDHFICKRCGKIYEFCDPRISEIQNDLAELYGVKIDTHSLYFYGYCKDCLEEMKKEQQNGKK